MKKKMYRILFISKEYFLSFHNFLYFLLSKIAYSLHLPHSTGKKNTNKKRKKKIWIISKRKICYDMRGYLDRFAVKIDIFSFFSVSIIAEFPTVSLHSYPPLSLQKQKH